MTNGDSVRLSLLAINEVRDSLRNAIRAAYATISVDGKIIIITSGNYNLPVVVGKTQIDCPITKGYYSNSNQDSWKLKKDARFRLWPKDSKYIDEGTFIYPIKQKWFANLTQSGNEPCYVNWGEDINNNKKIYYHSGHDIGGAEGLDMIISATDGLVISANNKVLDNFDRSTIYVHPDAVSIMNERGWILEYAHLDSTFSSVKLGKHIKKGQKIGYVGKQGESGGWVHLHFEIRNKEIPNGEWAIEDAYPYLWESYINQYRPKLIAVARPHHLVWTDQDVLLDGRKSKCFTGDIKSYEWTFTDGTKGEGAIQKKTYSKPGQYSEILKVIDNKGNVDFDFAVVQVYDRENPKLLIPTIQAAFHPTMNLKPGTPITFLVRTFNTDIGNEVWDFGDGSCLVQVKSETVSRENPTNGKFAKTIHSFSKPGHYIAKIVRSNENGFRALTHLHIEVKE